MLVPYVGDRLGTVAHGLLQGHLQQAPLMRS